MGRLKEGDRPFDINPTPDLSPPPPLTPLPTPNPTLAPLTHPCTPHPPLWPVQAEIGGLIRGAYDQAQAQQVGASQFASGTQEVVAEVELGVGTYTLIPSTFEARHEAPFALSLYHSTPNALQVTPLVGGQAVSGDAGRPGAARPQGPTGPPPSGSGKNQMAPPAAKYDVAEVRSNLAASRRAAGGGQSETEDDGKMGYAEKMEMEELVRLGKWQENVPMMTIEGQPLSDTCKKWAKDLTEAALAQVAATGRKFEDQGFGQLPLSWNQTGFPAMPGSAQSNAQPQVYGNEAGEPAPGMPGVTHWRRPEEMGMPTEPLLCKNDWEERSSNATIDLVTAPRCCARCSRCPTSPSSRRRSTTCCLRTAAAAWRACAPRQGRSYAPSAS